MKRTTPRTPILRTKLHRPPVPAYHVHRRELLGRLGKDFHRPLVLISAPAGYGKSTLVSHWLDRCDRPGAWVSLDETDNDLRQFISYLVAAVQTIFPKTAGNTKALLNAANLPPATVLAANLVNDLHRIGQDFIVVLDDIHCIQKTSVLDFLKMLLRHPSRFMQLVLVGRRDPTMPIASLRAKSLLTEIRMRDLRFTVEESVQFLESSFGQPIEKSVAVALAQKTEGWITGLRLAALAMSGHETSDHKWLELKGTTRFVVDYLVSEVLNRQPAGIRDILLNTAILDRFCAPLCEAVCRSEGTKDPKKIDGRRFVAWLCEHNLFVIPLDMENRWFRFHHLFKDLLRRQLKRQRKPAEIDELYNRASVWLEENKLIEESIRCAVSSGDISGAADIVERHRHAELNQDRWYVVDQWLGLVPKDIRRRRPGLLLAQAWTALHRYRVADLPPMLEQIASHLSNDGPLLGELHALWGSVHFWSGDGASSLAACEKAQRQLKGNRDLISGHLEMHLGLARAMNGQGKLAIRVLEDRIQDAGSQKGIYLSRLIAGLVFVFQMSGDLNRARQEARRLRTVAKKNGIDYTAAIGAYTEAWSHLHAHNLDQALRHFAVAVQQPYILHTRVAMDAFAGLAVTQQLMHQHQEADETIIRLQDFAREIGQLQDLPVIQSCKARLALLRGDLKAAAEYVRSVGDEPTASELFIWLEVPAITRARVLIARGSEKSLRKASSLLEATRRVSAGCCFNCQVIEVAVLQALVLAGLDRRDGAIETLKEAVALVKPHGWIRPFVEAGSSMKRLLVRLKNQNSTDAYVHKLLAAFTNGRQDGLPGTADAAIGISRPVLPTPQDSQSLKTALTPRELDIMELLSGRLQNKEIAEKLFISPTTVKTHLQNIYQKLGVTNRQRAVERGRTLNLF